MLAVLGAAEAPSRPGKLRVSGPQPAAAVQARLHLGMQGRHGRPVPRPPLHPSLVSCVGQMGPRDARTLTRDTVPARD